MAIFMAIQLKLPFEISKIAKIYEKLKVSLTHKFLFPWVLFVVKSEYDLETDKNFAQG